MAPTGVLRQGEEDWQESLDRLSERFTTVSQQRIAKVLRDCNGHAGMAAKKLRDHLSDGPATIDPDDAEQVATLLSNPMIFNQQCKIYFRKFDKDQNGVLDWSEVLALTNELYDTFGLDIPKEGSLRSFFDTTDANHDGVLSEGEFAKFLECFLRHAFFNAGGHGSKPPNGSPSPARQVAPEAHAERLATHGSAAVRGAQQGGERMGGAPGRTRQVVEDVRRSNSSADETRAEDGRAAPERRRQGVEQGRSERGSDARGAAAVLRCLAPHGVSYRNSADLADRTEATVGRGEVVRVQEIWIRTSEGWLPMVDGGGQPLFEPAQDEVEDGARGPERRHHRPKPEHSDSSGSEAKRVAPVARGTSGARNEASGSEARSKRVASAPPVAEPDNDERRETIARLRERFPIASAEEVAEVLRECDWHAGQAARMLRDMMKPPRG